MEQRRGPAWYYGPNGEAEIFTDRNLIPRGWKDHPFTAGVSKVQLDLRKRKSRAKRRD
ncbi:MAG: hypothetical protein ACT4OE_00120 [Sphingosinicella sp.]